MLYAMVENRKIDDRGPWIVTYEEAKKLNDEQNVGIFRSVNEFYGRRKKEYLKNITAWHVDIDKGSKAEQIIKINSSPIWPSRLVESKNGFHIYFNAKDAQVCFHKRIIEGLNRFFGGDQKAKMITALLREPDFWHKKDPSNPFKVVEKLNIKTRYTDEDMMYFFPVEVKLQPPISLHEADNLKINLNNLTEFLNNLDHEKALMRLSGSPYVNGETYSFKPVANGHLNILVNNKTTSCFIDKKKMIGATPGGPTLFQWIKYFNYDNRTVYRILKEIFGGEI